jgi:hypothetical protein
MKTLSWFAVAALAATLTGPSARAQQTAKPGPEHEMLKKLEGTWDTTMKVAGNNYKGTQTYKMDLGGLWLCGAMEGECPEGKFAGKSLDTFDAKKGKYVSVWFDSKSTTPMMMEGTCDKERKTLTLEGVSPGKDGKPTKFVGTYEMADENTMNFSMRMGDEKEPMFTVTYNRRK